MTLQDILRLQLISVDLQRSKCHTLDSKAIWLPAHPIVSLTGKAGPGQCPVDPSVGLIAETRGLRLA
jgi:hypothetical protein